MESALSGGKLSAETVSSYVSKLAFAQDITKSRSFASMAAKPSDSFAKLRRHYKSDATLKQTLTALLAGLRATKAPASRLTEWRALHSAVSKKAAAAHDGMITDGMKSKYVCWSKIVASELAARKRHGTLRESMDACLLALVTRLPPKRADFGELRVVKKAPRSGNAVVLPSAGAATLVLNDYKTSKSHGTLVESMTKGLTSVLRESLRRWPREHVFVSTTNGEPLSPGAYGAFVKAAMTRAVGKAIGPTMLRHIYISDIVAHSDAAAKQRAAVSMLHSSKEQAQYVVTLPGGRPVCPKA